MSENGLNRASRASRGKRMTKLLNEEAEADDEFWSQDAFKDDAEDNEYAAEVEEADVFDSDFDEDEPDEEEDFEEEERQPAKKRKLLLGTSQDKKKKDKKAKKDKKSKKDKDEKKEKKGTSFPREGTDPARLGGDGVVSHLAPSPSDPAQIDHQQENGEAALDVDGERSVRKSTRTAVVIKQAEREAHQAALQALYKPVKKKKEEERKISQEEMLLEAAQTEIQNLQALEIMLAREEEVKHKAIIQKSFYTGPQIRFHSRNGTNILEFTKVSDFPSEFNSSPSPYPRKAVCVVTGLPAKYRDPKSSLPYATKEAFKIIRERFDKGDNPRRKDPLEESHQRKRTKVERERSGSGGRTIVTKLKYKKVTNDSISNDDMAAVSHLPSSTSTPPFSKPGDLDDVHNAQHHSIPSKPSPFQDQVDVSRSENGLEGGSHLPKSLVGYDLQSLDMPSDDFVEANEADFMLDDLEVSLPSNLESGLSLPTSMAMSPMLLEHDDSRRNVAGDELEKGASDVPDEQKNQSLFSMPMLQLPDLEGLGRGPSAGKDIL